MGSGRCGADPRPAGVCHCGRAAHALAHSARHDACQGRTKDGADASLRILYGGSAKPGLYEHIYEGVDGLFLGRFAHDPVQFAKTIQEVYAAGRTGA